MNRLDFDEVGNLLFNLSAGLHPYNLTEDEVELLKEEYGENWLEELGYTQAWLSYNPV